MGDSTGYYGSIASDLQNKVDYKHSQDLQGHAKDIAQINYELRHVLQHLKSDFTKRVHDPDQEGPHDLTEHVEKFAKLEEIYQKFMNEVPDSIRSEVGQAEIPKLFSGDLQDVSQADLEKILRKIEDIETSHKDTVQDTTQQLYLLGQLFITLTDIIRKMDEGQRRFMERISEKAGR